MKKIYAKTAGKTKKMSCSNKNKSRRKAHGILMRSIERPAPEPSKLIKVIKTKNGKTVEIQNITGTKKQSEYTTDIAKNAMIENKQVNQSKKALVKKILKEAGYEPTVQYTRKEKKHFTRIVKNKLFATQKPIKQLSKEEYKKKFAEEQKKKKARLESIPHISEVQLPVTKGKQRPMSVLEYTKKETPIKRKFRYTINRQSEENPNRVYDFLTDYFDASTRDEAFGKAKEISKTYEKDTSFKGITVHDINGNNNIIYYTREKLAA